MSADRDYPAYFNVLNTQRIIGFEMLGMFFLALGATSCSYSALVDVCIPNVVFWVNVLSGPFTGAHLNAMITMSWVFKSWKQFQLPASFVFVYILAQCAGAFLGGAMLYFIHSTDQGEVRAPTINYQGDQWLRRDIMTETFIAGMYAFICHIINKKSVSFVQGQFQTWIIAAVGVFFARQYSIHSGGCMNPSLAAGLNLAKLVFEGYNSSMRYVYVYLFCPIVGSLIGTLFFDYVYCPCLAYARNFKAK